MPNQYLPNPPVETLAPHILRYWKMRKTDQEILTYLKRDHIDLTKYGLGKSRFVEMREKMGLLRARKQNHDVDSILPSMTRLRLQYPNAGAREMVNLLFHEENMAVPRSVVTSYFALYEADLVRKRRANRLRRKKWWAAGVNDIVAVDQHDKWKPKFGLGLHTGVEPFSGTILWLKVWHTNSNPKLILSYYLDSVTELGVIPLVTQSDPGSENFGLANGHTYLRHWHDPSLAGTLQHRWMREKKNIKPEIAWSQLRRRFTPGFEDILDFGVDQDWYHPDNTLEALVFRWVFIPWLQKELDAYKEHVNNTKKRANRHKILPHGVPYDIYQNAGEYGALDFKIAINPLAVNEARSIFCPPDDHVFELVPLAFSNTAQEIYIRNNSPEITRYNVWDVYLIICTEYTANLNAFPDSWNAIVQTSLNEIHDVIELQDGLSDLYGGMENPNEDGSYYMGGLNNGKGLDETHSKIIDAMMNEEDPLIDGEDEEVEYYACFTSDEDESNDDRGDW